MNWTVTHREIYCYDYEDDLAFEDDIAYEDDLPLPQQWGE